MKGMSPVTASSLFKLKSADGTYEQCCSALGILVITLTSDVGSDSKKSSEKRKLTFIKRELCGLRFALVQSRTNGLCRLLARN